MNRRVFSQTLSAALIASRAFAARRLTAHIGPYRHHLDSAGSCSRTAAVHRSHDGSPIRGGRRSRSADLGFYGIELFGNQIEAMEVHGGLGELLEKYKLLLISAYCGTILSGSVSRKTGHRLPLVRRRAVRIQCGSRT
jgi:hypothetical protein